jgi:eukaryotic-like serine/threonine-protein kinase
MIPEIGQKFGPYEILGKLGGGGMGLVFRAWDERLHREVAIKLLYEDYKMPGMRERFLQEARAASALNHPNICTVFDIGEKDHNPYLVMELLQGETVKDRIARGALSPEEIVRYAIEIADALGVANAKGIVHRDVKPANIFLVKMPTGKSQAKVLDFGLAKIGLEARGGWQSRTLDLTMAGSTVGTLAYMSPEQARGESLDVRSDLFSLGIVLYEMATRQAPFKGTTSAMMFVQLFSHDPEPVRTWNESIPRELEKIIFKLLEKDRRRRFQSSEELNEALGKLSSKVNRSSWLGKAPIATVPLVRASDPIARQRGVKRKPERTPGSPQEDLPPSSGLPANSMSNDVGLSLPMVVDHGGAPWRMLRSLEVNSIAGEKGAMPVKRHAAQSMVAEADSSDMEIFPNEKDNSLGAKPAWHHESIMDRLRDGATQLEYGLEKLKLGKALIEPSFDESVPRELAAASSAVASKTQVRIIGAAAFIVLAVAIVGMLRSGLFRPLVLGSNDRLLLTVIQNKTGDRTLDGTVMQGLETALRQSRSLRVLGGEAYRAGLRQVEGENVDKRGVPEQKVAQKVGARAYLYGEITGTEAPYTISVDVVKADSNDKVATLEETAERREDIPAAIGKVAEAVRAEVSEDGESAVRKSVPLQVEATGNVDALHEYATAESAMQRGSTRDAMAAYQQAAMFDPKFVQAQMSLAWLYRGEHAEVAAANAAEMAHNAAAHSSEKLRQLVQFCYEMNTSGDYVRAEKTIRSYVAKYPHDVDGEKGLARILRIERISLEGLQTAQQGYEDHPFDKEMYEEAELAMVAMDHFDNALQIEAQAERAGLRRGDVLLAAYLAGRGDIVSAQAGAMQRAISGESIAGDGQADYKGLYDYALYLDNTGRMSAGLEVWRAAAARAGNSSDLVSIKASMLAQAALDRALAESCTISLELANEVKSLPRGPVASFNATMAAAICGDLPYAEKTIAAIQQSFPQNTIVAKYYVPQLQAAAELGVNEQGRALPPLIALGQFEQMPLTHYLRGMFHAAQGQPQDAIQDFQTVLEHRGMAVGLGGNV